VARVALLRGEFVYFILPIKMAQGLMVSKKSFLLAVRAVPASDVKARQGERIVFL
jgi:hypothetical protein